MLAVLVFVQSLQHLGDVAEQCGLVLDPWRTSALYEATHGRKNGAMILDEDLQLIVIA